MSITVKPSNFNPNVKRARPDGWKTPDPTFIPAPEPVPAPVPALVIEDGKLPTPQAAALDYVAKQNELLRRRKNKQANK
jgi:hypothetical protein